MKYTNSFLIVLFILIPSPTEYIIDSFPLNYVNLLLLTIVILNFKKLTKNTFHISLIFCLIKLVVLLVFSSNSYVCFNDNNVEEAQSSQFKVSKSNCRASFNEPTSNLDLYSEKIVSINNFQLLENNQSIQNTTWDLGFVNDKKYNYFREYEQSQLWFPIEAYYFIENSELNYSIINIKYSGELIIYQDDIEIFNDNSYNFIAEELIVVDSTKDINIDYKFKSFATATTLPGYTYATLIISNESSGLLRLISNFEIVVFIELILFLLFLYFCIFFDLFVYICYSFFMLDNLLINSSFNKVNPYTKVDTANGMPINDLRVVEPVNNSLRSKEFVERQNLRDVYAKNLSPSVGFNTEKFLKSRSLLAPVFSYNEAVSKYDMISRINMSNKDMQSEVNILA